MFRVCSALVLFTGFIAVQYFTVVTSNNVICVGYCTSNCSCPNNYSYQCGDGTCIELSKWRNSVIDCDDETDEAIVCCPNQFKCDTRSRIGKCLNLNLLDNGVTECVDKTDETKENIVSCNHYNSTNGTGPGANVTFYQCHCHPNGSKVGRCIPIDYVLDGKEDCPLGDDEDGANFNECTLPHVFACGDNADCKNIDGGTYTCTCKTGYIANGENCILNSAIVGG